MTDAQLEKARRLRDEAGMENVSFEQGYIESLPFDDDSFDVGVFNGVINLSAGKEHVFAEVRRVLRPAGRLALSDISDRGRVFINEARSPMRCDR